MPPMKRSGRNSTQKVVYRFKTWTRKSYSVFNSLGRLISIGFLATSVSERVGAKSKSSLHKLSNFLRKDLFSNDDSGGMPVESTAPEEVMSGFLATLAILLVSQQQWQECCSRKISGNYFQFTPSFPLSYLVLLSLLPFFSKAFHSIYLLINNKFQTDYSNLAVCYGTAMFKTSVDAAGDDCLEHSGFHTAIKKLLEKNET